MTCPRCREEAVKVIYAGFPMRLCANEQCGCCFGFWAWILEIVPFNGWFLQYDNYWSGLWEFLTERHLERD